VAGIQAAFLSLKREGKVRAVGLSNHTCCSSSRPAGRSRGFAEPPFSAIRGMPRGAGVVAYKNGTGVIVYSPMQSGLGHWKGLHAERARRFRKRRLASAAASSPAAGLARNLALAQH